MMWSIWTSPGPPPHDEFSIACFVIEMMMACSAVGFLALAAMSTTWRTAAGRGRPVPLRTPPRVPPGTFALARASERG